MKINSLETEELLRLAEKGDDGAIRGLFERHRGRLRRMVAARLDRRVAARVDPSDVVQEALGEASGKTRRVPPRSAGSLLLLAAAADPPPPRMVAPVSSGIAQAIRAARDQDLETRPSDNSSALAVDRLPGSDTSPSQHAVRDEECERVRAVLDQLEGPDREFIELRYVEQLSLAEIADRLEDRPERRQDAPSPRAEAVSRPDPGTPHGVGLVSEPDRDNLASITDEAGHSPD